MDARGDDHLDVVDPVIGQHLQHNCKDPLAHVRRLHGRQGQRDVVDRDDDLHPRLEQRVEGLGLVRVMDRVADGRLNVLQRLERGLRVDDARARRQIDVHQLVAVKERAGGASAVEGDDAGVAHAWESRWMMGQ